MSYLQRLARAGLLRLLPPGILSDEAIRHCSTTSAQRQAKHYLSPTMNEYSPLISYLPEEISVLIAGDILDPATKRIHQLIRSGLLPNQNDTELLGMAPWALLRVAKLLGAASEMLGEVTDSTTAAHAITLDPSAIPLLAESALSTDAGREIIVRAMTTGGLAMPQTRDCIARAMTDPNRLFRMGYYDEAENRANSTPDEPLVQFFRWWKLPPVQARTMEEISRLPEEYVYRFALRCRALGNNISLGGVLTPRWAFHALRDGLAGSADIPELRRLLAVLHKDALWTAAYITVAQIPPREGIAHLRQVPPEHWGFGYLERWTAEYLTHPLEEIIQRAK